MIADTTAITAFAITAAAAASWVRRMQAVRIPSNRRWFVAAMGTALVLGIVALALAPGALGKVLAWVSVAAGATFVFINLMSGQESREPAVAVGAPVVDFAAEDEDGKTFELGSLRGKPFLLKFFRGHW